MGRAVHAGARRDQPAVLPLVRGRADQRHRQLPGPPRRSGSRRPCRPRLVRRGRRGAHVHLRRAARRRPAPGQRPTRAGRAQGRRRRHLPADDPRGDGRDARVRAHRRPAQRRLRRLQRRIDGRARGGLARESAHHRRRRAAQGQDSAGEGRRRRRDRRPRAPPARRRRAPHRARGADERGPRRLLRRPARRRRSGLPGRADAVRAPAIHPLQLGLDGQAEGHRARNRRLPDRRGGDVP
jgi:hypothetical protein